MAKNTAKNDIKEFWGSLYYSLYDGVDQKLTRDQLLEALDQLEDMFRFRNHMAVVDMQLDELFGKRVLEIGPGSGGHSALFAKYGAIVTSVDITLIRASSTQKKFLLLGKQADGCHAIQSDAENLPFSDNSFDIVYSNGVLHHTSNSQSATDEVYRVLKPEGEAIIMLYCKSSWHYWVNMVLAVGIFQGRIFCDRNWLGRATEWGGKNEQTVKNPITRCYSRAGIKKLFKDFQVKNLRKSEFYFYLIPKIGRLYRHWQIKTYGVHRGGMLVYGEPWPIQSRLELFLGKIMGWSWFIRAVKKKRSNS
ncbi:class I SAM-dependent methyltransferase [Rhodospirillales bacterium]|nr:class I SAM-dependent methyltransferase [Rhodospirillales bacterium]